jgi:hypothetical protein
MSLNVALAQQLDNARADFALITVERVLHYATMRTEHAGKGASWGRRGKAFASVAGAWVSIEATAESIVLRFGRTTDDGLEELPPVSLPLHESPAGIAANHAWRLRTLWAAVAVEAGEASHASDCPTHIDHALRCRCAHD